MFFPDEALATSVALSVLLAMVAVLVLSLVALRRPANAVLISAAAILVVAVVTAAFAPLEGAPWWFGALLALVATGVSVAGGYSVVRAVLDLAMGRSIPQGIHGGILVTTRASSQPGVAPVREEVLRGGMTIGLLERTGTTLALIAGFPEAIAIIVALKGIGRFSELATPAARERFIIGTLASLVWAALAGAVVHLLMR